jgi:hypothetical protein
LSFFVLSQCAFVFVQTNVDEDMLLASELAKASHSIVGQVELSSEFASSRVDSGVLGLEEEAWLDVAAREAAFHADYALSAC